MEQYLNRTHRFISLACRTNTLEMHINPTLYSRIILQSGFRHVTQLIPLQGMKALWADDKLNNNNNKIKLLRKFHKLTGY